MLEYWIGIYLLAWISEFHSTFPIEKKETCRIRGRTGDESLNWVRKYLKRRLNVSGTYLDLRSGNIRHLGGKCSPGLVSDDRLPGVRTDLHDGRAGRAADTLVGPCVGEHAPE